MRFPRTSPPNPALHTEEGAGPELQVVTPDPSSGQARGQAQAAESRKPRRPQKSRIREIYETAAFHTRSPLNTRKPPTQTPNQSDASRTPPRASKAVSRVSPRNLEFSPGFAGSSFGDRGAGFAGAPTSLPAGLCFPRCGGPAWSPVQSPNPEPPRYL